MMDKPTLECLNCASKNLKERRLSSHTSEYACQNCRFVFTDDDRFDTSGRVKVELHRKRFGKPATTTVNEQMWDILNGLKAGAELITDLATGRTDICFLMQAGKPYQTIPKAIVQELADCGRIAFNPQTQAYDLVE